MTTYRFQVMPATTKAHFSCPSCGKGKRSRTFRAECTVNPFNTNDAGVMRTPAEVRRQSQQRADDARRKFMSEPLCSTCEDALSWTDRKALHERRTVALSATVQS